MHPFDSLNAVVRELLRYVVNTGFGATIPTVAKHDPEPGLMMFEKEEMRFGKGFEVLRHLIKYFSENQ